MVRVNEVGRWASFTCALKWGDVDTWELVLPYDEFLDKWDLPISPASLVGTTYGIAVYRAGILLIAGPITEAHREKAGDDDLLTLTGASDTYYLSTRYTWPRTGRPYNGYDENDELRFRWTDYDDVPVSGSTVSASLYPGEAMAAYVENNLCGSAWHGTIQGHTLDRRFAWDYNGQRHITTDAPGGYQNGSKPTDDYYSRWESLLEVCKRLSSANVGTVADECGFKIVNYDDGLLRFYTYSPYDATGKAVFGAEFGTIQSYEYTERKPDMNSVMVLGPAVADGGDYTGTDNDMTLYNHIETDLSSQSVGVYGVIEGTYDFSGTDSNKDINDQHAEMWDAGVTQANEKSYNIEVKLTLSESETVRFLSEYNIGFIVDVALDSNTRYTDIIREIDISLDKDGEVIQPIVASPSHFKMASPAEEAAYSALKLGLELARNKK